PDGSHLASIRLQRRGRDRLARGAGGGSTDTTSGAYGSRSSARPSSWAVARGRSWKATPDSWLGLNRHHASRWSRSRVAGSTRSRIGRAGTPPTMEYGATSSVTTAPAATTAPSPIVTPRRTTALAPIHTSLPTMEGAPRNDSRPPASGSITSTRSADGCQPQVAALYWNELTPSQVSG